MTLTHTLEALPGNACGSYLLLAGKGDTTGNVAPEVAVQHWALLAEHPHAGVEALVDSLREQGQVVSLLAPGDAHAVAQQLLALAQAPQQVVHVAGLDAAQGLDAQGARCMQAAALVQACESLAMAPTCWLLSRGAAGHWYGAEPASDVNAIADAAFWGFGRTLVSGRARTPYPAARIMAFIDAGRGPLCVCSKDFIPDWEDITGTGEKERPIL